MMKLVDMKNVDNKSEYIVEFECVSKMRVTFEDVSDLNKAEIADKAVQIVQEMFKRDGLLITERIAKDHSYAFTAMGIDPKSANILNQPKSSRNFLKLIK